MARSLNRFREKLVELHRQREDLDDAIHALEEGCVRLERQLSELRPDLLPQAADYESALKGRLDGVPGHAAE
jgi:predicted  nucleic acid-binding Zn-ribbon protein